jgi:tetratricopeptide (TPR) repeat protein
LKSSLRLWLTTICITLFSLSSLSQKKAPRQTDFERGYNYWYAYKSDSALLFFDRYVNNADDSLKKGTAYKFIGEMQAEIGDYYGAQASLTNAIRILDPLNASYHPELAIVYNVLGNVSKDIKKYDEAQGFYNTALHFANGSEYRLEIMNGKAIALQKEGNYAGAIALYDALLKMQPEDPFLTARLIDNRAISKWQQDPGYNALPDLWRALKIRTEIKSNIGLNASYAHLSEYYAQPNPDSALWYAKKMRSQATQNQSREDMLEAIGKLIQLTSTAAQKVQLFIEYKNINDSLQQSRDTTRNRFALIRYDVQKNKADNLVLQQHITRQEFYMLALASLALVIITGLYLLYAKRRKRLKLESENAIRNASLKTSQKVHDVVANGLYIIMNELEHQQELERETLINKIEGLYEKSRNISYEDTTPLSSAGYDVKVHDLLTSFANMHTKVIVIGNQPAFWNNITGHQKKELQLSLNELMVNMQKHSQAKNVVIGFKQEQHTAFIDYKDDGVGLPADVSFGNGLNNTVCRIKSLNGEVNFDNTRQAGVSIKIRFPLEPIKHD